jgi:chemotaxis protein histidine kinase CheA
MKWITRFLKNSKGAVTVIVTLLLIPSILVSGTAVDVARIYSAKSIVQDANSLGANAAMAQYNALLKDLYGLYGIEDTKLQSMVNDYIKIALFGDSNTNKGMGTFQPFYGSDSSLSISVSSEHNLGELEILQRQIEEYMALRAPVVIADDIMDIIDSMKKVSADANVIKQKLDIDDELEEIHEIYKKIYQTIGKLDEYPNEETIILKNVNDVLEKINGQFGDLKTERETYAKLKTDFEETKNKFESEMKKLSTELAIKEADKVALNSEKSKKEQALSSAEDRKRAAESKAEEQRKAAQERAEADRIAAEEKAKEDETREEKSEDEKTEEEKAAEESKAQEEQKAAESKAQEEQQAADEVNQTQQQIDQANNEIQGLSSEIQQLDNSIATVESDIQNLKDSIAELGKKLAQETAIYEAKRLECKAKYKVILANISSLASGGLLEEDYKKGEVNSDNLYIAGRWQKTKILIGGNAGDLWGDNMSLSACQAGANKTIDHYKKLAETLVNQLKKAEEKKAKLKAKLTALKGNLNNCSEGLKDGLTQKKQEYGNQSLLEYYEKILEYDLNSMAEDVVNTDQRALEDMQRYMDEMGYGIAEIGMTGGSLSDGKVISVKNLSPINFEEFCDMEYPEKNPGLTDVLKLYAELTKEQYSFVSQDEFQIFKEISEDTGKFYDVLEEIMNSAGVEKESEIKTSITQILKVARDLLQGSLNIPEGAAFYATSIGGAVTSDFGTQDNWDDTKEAKKSAKNALDNPLLSGLSTIANDCTNKLLLVTYGTSMFSNYATNKPNAAEKKEVSLAEIPFGKEVNYFYQSEQEFLYGGSSLASDNLKAVSGMIFLVRFIMNYVSSFVLSDVTGLVRNIALALPFPANIIVSELARFGLVVGQSVIDLNKLRMGYRIPIMHTEASHSWQLSPSGIASLGSDAVKMMDSYRTGADTEVDEGTGFSYANYLSVLLLFVDKAMLTQRIQLLIELNLTNYKNNVNTDEAQMASLERIRLDKYAAGICVSTSIQMKTLFFTMKMFQDGINGVKPSATYTISDTVYRGY